MCPSFSQIIKKDKPVTRDTTVVMPDTTLIDIDSVLQTTDMGSQDIASDTQKANVKIATNGLDAIIERGAKDSSYVDVKESKIHLFGEAFVKYKGYDLKAGYIIFDFKNNEASAFSLKDAHGILRQKPDFTDGTNKFKANQLRFNFKTNKGLIYDAVTNEGEFTIHGEKTKFVSKDDSIYTDDHIYNKNAIITTCTADHPHYGIKARKLKVIPNKLAIIGLSQMEIMGIPTPIILPFGFFPLVEGRSSGLIFPDNYEYKDELGLGFRNIGYYFPINDYLDLTLTGDIYTRGTHRINVNTRYAKRYKYNGSVNLEYANNITESSVTGRPVSNKGWSIKINHVQNAKAHPYRKIEGNINISTNRFDQANRVDFEDVVNNKISSNFYLKYAKKGSPFSFSTAFTHFQDNKTREVKITFPDAKLRMNSIYPFKRKKATSEAWYEKINVGYNANFKNFVSTTDTTLFTNETLKNLQTGLSHNATANASYNVLKHFNLNLSANAEQYVLTRTFNKILDPTILYDTTGYEVDQAGDSLALVNTTFGTVNDVFLNELASLEKFNMSADLSTQLFATKTFSKGWLRGLRHTMRPRVGFSYAPDTESKYLRKYNLPYNPNEIDEVQTETYNPFTRGAFNPSLNRKQMAITYGITNFFEGKYYSKQDSTEKKFKLLQSLNVNGTYNFAADSLNFSPLNISGNTSIFKGITTVNFSLRYNFYVTNEKGVLINKSIWEDRKRPLEFDNFNFTISNGLSVSDMIGWFSKDKNNNTSKNVNPAMQNSNNKVGPQSLGDMISNFRISHSLRFEIFKQNNGRDTSLIRNHSIQLSGNVPLTSNWRLDVRNIQYDLVSKKFVYPQFSLNRDLHCWTMMFSWTPAIETYSFFIGVKSNSLSFLKYNYGDRSSSQLLGGRPR